MGDSGCSSIFAMMCLRFSLELRSLFYWPTCSWNFRITDIYTSEGPDFTTQWRSPIMSTQFVTQYVIDSYSDREGSTITCPLI